MAVTIAELQYLLAFCSSDFLNFSPPMAKIVGAISVFSVSGRSETWTNVKNGKIETEGRTGFNHPAKEV